MEFFLGSSFEGINLEEILNLVNPLSPYGEEVKRSLTPSTKINSLKREYNRVELLLETIKRYPEEMLLVRDELSKIKDVQPIISKAFKGLVLEDKDFFYLKQWLLTVQHLVTLFKKTKVSNLKIFKLKSNEGYRKILFLDNEGPSFYISEKHNDKLGVLRRESRKLKEQHQKLIALAKKEIENRYESIKFNIENSIKVSKFDTDTIRELSVCPMIYYYGETYSHVEFKLKKSEAILSLEKMIEDTKQDIEKEEYLVREYLSKSLIEYIPEIVENCKIIGTFDWMLAKAYYCKEIRGVAPELVNDNGIFIDGARNPILERALAKRSKQITPISINLKEGVTVITGANMGGKSVTLKTLGLIVALAQMGFLVPCQRMRFSPREFIFFSQDEGQSIHDGLSTFGMEIKGIKKALNHYNKEGLYLIDELARGTNPVEGGALALSIAHYLNNGKGITVMTTHFEDLIIDDFSQLRIVGLENLPQSQLKKALKGKKGFEVVEDLMDYRLKRVSELGVPREGIKIAELMGIPRDIIEMAKGIISSEGRNKNG